MPDERSTIFGVIPTIEFNYQHILEIDRVPSKPGEIGDSEETGKVVSQ